MERCYLKSYKLPWSKLYPPAKPDTVQITHTEFCAVFSGKLLFLRSLSGIPSLSCVSQTFVLWYLWKLQMLYNAIRAVEELISKSTIKTSLKDIFIRTLYMDSSKDSAIDFCSEILSLFLFCSTFWQNFKPHKLGSSRFQLGFYAVHLISSGHILPVSLSTLQGEEPS